MNFQLKAGRLARLLVTTGFALALALSTSGAALAKHEDGIENDPFTPRLSFSATTSQGGANPDLTFEMHKQLPNQCLDYAESPGPASATAECDDMYVEENLKQMTVSLPPGVLPDVNAAPYCGLRSFGLLPGTGVQTFGCANEDALVGVVDVTTTDCRENFASWLPFFPDDCLIGFLGELVACPDPQRPPSTGYTEYLGYLSPPSLSAQPPAAGPTYACRSLGYVYNEEPRTDDNSRRVEDGHLVIVWPRWPREILDFDTVGGYVTPKASHVSVNVRASDFGVDSVAEIPDAIPSQEEELVIPGQPSDVVLTLFGATGAQRGHPLLTNPTFCSSQSLDAEFLGYAHNSGDDPNLSGPFDYVPGFGDGKVVEDSVPFQVTNCEAIPYAPTFAASADNEAPGAAAALSTVITQKDDEATTKKVHIEFPKGMGVNINSTLKPCSAADLAAKSCPEVSKMGTVSAESRLLPKREILGDSVKPEDEVLTGNVYLTGQEGNKLTLSALLSGFVDVRLDARAGVDADGNVTATFDDLPSLPYSKFTLNLFGGDKGLLTNPRACGTHTTRATFTSHSGKTHTVETTSQVKGCSPPPELEFEVDLSNDGKGKRTAVEFDLTAQDRYIKKVTFGLPRYLKFSTKRLGKRKGFGSLAIETKRGDLETSLSLSQSVRAKRKKKKAIRFSTKGALNKLKVSLFKRKVGTKKIKIRTKSGKKKTLKRSVLKSRMSLKSLPKQDIKGLRVEINPSESRFLRNPKGCKKPLRFLAFVTTSDGKRHVLSQKIKLKGKGCSKKKKKKK